MITLAPTFSSKGKGHKIASVRLFAGEGRTDREFLRKVIEAVSATPCGGVFFAYHSDIVRVGSKRAKKLLIFQLIVAGGEPRNISIRNGRSEKEHLAESLVCFFAQELSARVISGASAYPAKISIGKKDNGKKETLREKWRKSKWYFFPCF